MLAGKLAVVWGKWKKTRLACFLALLWQDMNRTDVFNHAYAMAYVTLFSLVPSLAVIFSLISLFTPMFGENSSLIIESKRYILMHLATGSGQQAIDYLENFLANTDFKKIGMTGFGGTVVTLILLLKQVELALNHIFQVQQSRSLFIRFIYFWTFLTLGTFSMALAIGAVSGISWGSRALELSLSLKIINDLIYAFSIFLIFLMLYKVVPNRFIPWKNAMFGGAVAALLFTQAVRFFTFYVAEFTSYEAIYGALSALPIFLFWLYVVWLITLIGALVTKRSMEKFYHEEQREEELHHHLQNHYFDSLLPFLTLLKVYEAFERSNGKGMCAADVAKELSISIGSARKALNQLVCNDLAIALHSENTDAAVVVENAYFPRLPIKQMTYREIKEKLLGNEERWLQFTTIPIPDKGLYSAMIKAFFIGETRTLEADLQAAPKTLAFAPKSI